MQFKTFTRLFLLIGITTMLSAHSFADEIQIGSGTNTDYNLPTQSNYNYSLTQQIYTAAEIEDAGGGAGTISSIAFYNDGSTKTRNFSIYLVNTDKDSFSGATNWITASSSNLVFSGSVEMTAGGWKTIELTNTFSYDGGNLAVIVDDNTNSCSYGMGCRYYIASSTQSLYYRDDNTNPAPTNPTISGTPTTYKNQIKLDITLAAVTCAKPKNFNATGITAHTATLTWTAGAEGQTNWDVFVTTDATIVPDENTTPTYQVTTCSKALSGLEAQTPYYTYVRSACGGDDGNSKWAKKVFTTTREAQVVDSGHPYSQNFETSNDWGFTNGDLTNKWCYGSATNNGGGGSKAMYVSNDSGTTNAYTLNSTTVVFASKLLAFANGTYTFTYDWKADGESNSTGTTHYDYIRAALAPGDVEFSAGTSLPSGVSASALPSGWIALDGGHQLNKSAEWQSQSAEVAANGTYTMVFIWRNDSGSGNQPPAAIDNISISYMTCPRPTNLTVSNITGRTATLIWAENGTATNWVLQYATNSTFTENLTQVSVSGIASQNLTSLIPETKYYARVKSVLGSDESSWSDVTNFTTMPTCIKPTSVTATSITAFTANIGWTNGEEGQDAWEISYSTSTQSNPENGTVIAVDTNPYTLTGLTPETSYYVYVRADCGSEDGKSTWSSHKYFTTLATCVKPTNLAASNVTATTATITWTAGEAGQDVWNLQYKKSSDSEWQTVAVTTTSYNLTNLTPVTTYNIRVQADCGDGDLSKWAEASFSTQCGDLPIPYFYDFESNLQTGTSYPMPKCWERIQYVYQYSTYYPYVYTASSLYPYAHGGNGANSTSGKSLRFYKSSSTSTETAILPAVEEGYHMSDLQIRFWARSTSDKQTISVGVMTSPATADTYTEVSSVEDISTSFTEFTIPLSSYEGNGRHIAIRCGTGSGQPIFIDDITVEEIPSCPIPTGLAATVNSATETVLTWIAGLNETDWELEVVADGSSISQSIPVSSTPTYPLSTTRATSYTVRVRANCGEGDYSEWSNPVNFTSDCGVLTVDATHPFLEDFENVEASDFPPICWDKFYYQMTGNTNSYWYLNSNNSLGSNAAYSYWNGGYGFLVMPLMHINGNANLSFDHLISDGDYNENCSVVVSTGAMTNDDFSYTIWEGNGPTSGKASETVSLSAFNNQDVYIAFKYKGTECTWYVDNVQVYVGEIFPKDIDAYNGDGGYYLIASPVGTVDPENVIDMCENNYDLYAFDQAQNLEWRNYKASTFSLEPGKGYLYANSEGVTLRFIGTPYNGSGVVNLNYSTGAEFAGWNLIGNPFVTTATLDKPYYRLNNTGSALKTETENTAVNVMEGVFVQATTTGQSATFTAQTRGSEQTTIALANIVVSDNKGNALDNAIIRFDNGETLGKFQLKENSTKVYIPIDGKDYAIVNAEAQNELPVNFKVEKNGNYTLSFFNENVEFGYLHLIDNMTGKNVDLMQNPSYSFEAKTTDYASRFKLLFATGNNGNDDNFAFFSNGSFVINNEGRATLQVIDMTGRILSSEQINGCAETRINAAAGVYVLRLVNGEKVRTQKVIVK